MRKFLLMAMFLAACSSAPTRRTDYCDGVEVCPPEAFTHPGYTPAGAGLPEYRPTEEEPEVSRGKDRRVLPATRGPGIWASDGDETRAAMRQTPVPPSVGPVALSFPETATTEEERKPTRKCARSLNAAISSAAWDSMMRLSPRLQACLVARLYAYCTTTLYNVYETKAWEHAYQSAVRSEEKICKGFTSADTEPVYTDIATEWHKVARVREVEE